jgi:hypothetical protein
LYSSIGVNVRIDPLTPVEELSSILDANFWQRSRRRIDWRRWGRSTGGDLMKMIPTTRLGIDVEVSVDGSWRPGQVEHWRQVRGRWESWVRYSTAVGETRIGWFDADVVRRPN